MAFTYDSIVDATEAAEILEIETSLIRRNHETGFWGWQDMIGHDPSANESDPASDDARNADDSGNADDGGEPSGEQTAPEANPLTAFCAPKEGEMMLVVGAGMLPAMARIEMARLAKKLGVAVFMVDAVTKALVEHRMPGPKSERGEGGGIERDERGLTGKQAIILDLTSRLDGATSRELIDAGATDGKAINWEYQMNCVTRATKGAWRMMLKHEHMKARMEKNAKGNYRSADVYVMREVPEADRVRVLYETEVHMVARKQLKAVIAPKPVAPANDAEAQKMAAD